MLSNHTPLMVNISIFEKHIQTRKHTIVKNSEEERSFIAEIIESIQRLNTKHISSKKNLGQLVQDVMHNMDKIWLKHSKIVNITRHSRSWWSEECQRRSEKYRSSRCLEDWKNFKSAVKKTKQKFVGKSSRL